jgi:hypothetical protein
MSKENNNKEWIIRMENFDLKSFYKRHRSTSKGNTEIKTKDPKKEKEEGKESTLTETSSDPLINVLLEINCDYSSVSQISDITLDECSNTDKEKSFEKSESCRQYK